jgi:trans-2,3-dihydro-3-hydroxyanthranilate isomerase
MTPRRYTVLDVFTDVPLEGNPVAIFADGSGLAAGVMQQAALELHLSETVFVLPSEGGADAAVRIFTPSEELPFAGHPVLGTGFFLGAQSDASVITLQTGAGPVPVALSREDGQIVFGEMDQPIPEVVPFSRGAELLAALGVLRSELPIEAYRNGPTHVYVALPDEATVAALRPDLTAISDLGPGVGVSCFAGAGTRIKTRMFAPGLGVPEDPATGSAAGPLALHLLRHGRIEFGQQIEIRQGEEILRPSLLYARIEGSGDAVSRVVVGGSAVTVAHGEYRLD